MEIAVAYSPCHISGLAVLYRDSSVGAGISLEEGMTTKVEVKKSGTGKYKFFMNNHNFENPVTSIGVLRLYKQEYGKNFDVTVNHYCNLPSGYGLGISGAGALSLSYAMNHALGLGLSEKDVIEIANQAELESRTGLSTVIGESMGGFLIRPKHKFRDMIHKKINEDIFILPMAPLSTKQIISTDFWKSKINMFARKAMKEFMNDMTISGLIRASRTVAIETGLAELNSFFYKYLLANEDAGMAMFGFTMFSNRPIGHPRVIKTRVSTKKACLL